MRANTSGSRSARLGCAVFGIVLLMMSLSSCSSVSGGTRSPVNKPEGPSVLSAGRSISSVKVELDPAQLTGEVAQVALDYEITRILTNRVNEQLNPSGGRGLEVHVDVIGLRLRSNGTAIWWGVMSGGDWITVDVEVREGGNTIKTFQTGTSTALGGAIYGGRSTRVGRMMKTLAKRIADGI